MASKTAKKIKLVENIFMLLKAIVSILLYPECVLMHQMTICFEENATCHSMAVMHNFVHHTRAKLLCLHLLRGRAA